MSLMLPLPLTCFEEYMLCDDRPSHPMLGIARLRFSGHLDRNAFEAAVSTTVHRHVLLRSSIARGRRGKPQWTEHPDWCPDVEWEPATNRHGFPDAPYVDITARPGTRVWVVDRGPGHDVILQIHHCAADAQGISQVMEDLLVGYALRVGASEPTGDLAPLEAERLRQRGTPGLTPMRWLGMAHKQAVGLLGVREFLSRRPVTLTGDKSSSDEDTPPEIFPCPQVIELDQQETGQLLAAAKSLGVTVNDLLLRDLFLALTAWRKELSRGSDRDWLRVSIPMSLRTADDVRMPMANAVSMVFIDRRGLDTSDPAQLLQGLRRQMQRIKGCRLQYTFLLSLAVARRLPGGLASSTKADTVQASSCFSNIGMVLNRTPLPRREGRLVAGGVLLESVDFVIPLRPHLHAAFCVYTYAGCLRILLNRDAKALSDEQATDLHDRFMQQIRRTLADARRD